jgi:hypothetical protein
MNLMAADEKVLNTVHKKNKKSSFEYIIPKERILDQIVYSTISDTLCQLLVLSLFLYLPISVPIL